MQKYENNSYMQEKMLFFLNGVGTALVRRMYGERKKSSFEDFVYQGVVLSISSI